MKKIFLGIAVFLLVISLSACGRDEGLEPLGQSEAGEKINQENDRQTPELGTKVTPTNQTNQNLETNNQPVVSTPSAEKKTTMPTFDQQENLVAIYSQATINTNYGSIKVKFYGTDSPKTVNNFLNLAKSGFYNGTKFHRVIKDFMIQGGDPLTKGEDTYLYGTGGPGYKFDDEFNTRKLTKGSLAMANSGPNTNGSQFFIVTAESTPWLDGKHVNFGEVVDGLDVVAKIKAAETDGRDKPVKDVIVSSIELAK